MWQTQVSKNPLDFNRLRLSDIYFLKYFLVDIYLGEYDSNKLFGLPQKSISNDAAVGIGIYKHMQVKKLLTLISNIIR